MPDHRDGTGDCPPAGALGLLGGTFDPVHRAHLQLGLAALNSGAIARLRWIPAGHPPHRPAPVANAKHRLAMLQLALATLPDPALHEIDDAEVASPKASYTIDTLLRLRAELGPTQPLALILGADAFLGLPSWHRWDELLSQAHLLVTQRPGHRLDPHSLPPALRPLWQCRHNASPAALGESPAGLIHCFEMPANTLSATALRARLARQGTADLNALEPDLPPQVIRYIEQHRLYC